MKYSWDGNSRKRILGKAAQYLHNRGANDLEGFLPQMVNRVASYIEERGKFPEENEIPNISKGLKTSLFNTNRSLNRKEFISWLACTLQTEGTKVINTKELFETIPDIQVDRVSIDDIDSFREVKRIPAHSVRDIVPVNMPENEIKQSIADILGEAFVQKDWSGEIADLFSSHVVYKGKRLAAGFLLKGPGVKGSLTIKNLGKNGDQIVRLTSTSLEIYVVQYVGAISQAVVEHLVAQVLQAAQKAGQSRYYCLIDGTDTARLLRAYDRM